MSAPGTTPAPSAPAPSTPAAIGLDWGISSFRAYLLDGAGAVLDRVDAPAGIATIPDRAFEAALVLHAGHLLARAPGAPILAAGMITSREGWRETPYLELPAGAAELAGGLVFQTLGDGRRIAFVPGLCRRQAGRADVMRGEETQLMGAGIAEGLVVLPGTHSKWAWLEGGRVAGFTTFPTGELFALVKSHSMIGRALADDDGDAAGFAAGLAAGRQAGGLLSGLFSVRAAALLDLIPGGANSAYLSGLLIAREVAEGLALPESAEAGPVHLIGRPDLCARYAQALADAGRPSAPLDQDAADFSAPAGLHAIARAAGLNQS